MADRTENLQLQNNLNSQNNIPSETRKVKSIQTKLKNNNPMITRPEKGKSIVILPIQRYDNKIQNFLDEKMFRLLQQIQQKPFKIKLERQ